MKLRRSDKRLLNELNRSSDLRRPVEPDQLERLSGWGLVAQTRDGQLTITARGQLELMRCRYRGIAKQRYVVMGTQHRPSSFLQRLVNILTEPRQK
jgi:hypothetical protein